jgi:hypothetical protein
MAQVTARLIPAEGAARDIELSEEPHTALGIPETETERVKVWEDTYWWEFFRDRGLYCGMTLWRYQRAFLSEQAWANGWPSPDGPPAPTKPALMLVECTLYSHVVTSTQEHHRYAHPQVVRMPYDVVFSTEDLDEVATNYCRMEAKEIGQLAAKRWTVNELVEATLQAARAAHKRARAHAARCTLVDGCLVLPQQDKDEDEDYQPPKKALKQTARGRTGGLSARIQSGKR